MDMNAVKVPLVDLQAQYKAIGEEVRNAIAETLRRTDFILGEAVSAFEADFAAYCGARFSVGVDSGTSALELILRAYDIGPGDEVITAANTFIATALAIHHTDAKPVLVDIDPETYTIDVSLLEQAITERTRAIIPVHLYGHPADMDPIVDIARRHDLAVIEDACQAHGATYKGQRVGTLGDAAAFSFYPAKNLGAYGDAGMVVTNHAWVAESIQMLRNYGQQAKYYHVVPGYNRRLDTLQAAVLRVKLKYLDAWNEARRQHARTYRELLAHEPVVCPQEARDAKSVYHLYVIRAEDRDTLQEHLHSQGIATGIHYPIPIHMQPAWQHLGYRQGSFPITETYAGQILSLPMYPELTQALIRYVVESIRTCIPDQEEALAVPTPQAVG